MSQLVAALRRHERAVEEARRKVDTRRESSIEINPGAVPIQQRAGHPPAPFVMLSSRVAVPFVVVYMTAGFIMEALFVGVRLATVAQPRLRLDSYAWMRF